DFYNITDLLTEEELAIQKTAHDFVKNEFMPIIQKHFSEATFPTNIIQRLGEIGVFGATFPEEYGGTGISNVAYGLLMQELERGDSGLRSFASVQGGLVMYPILEYGSEEQKNKWLPKLARGEIVGCFGLTEPEFGSNPGGMITRAKRNGDDWILNGSKMWITNGSIADIAIVWAKDEDDVIRGFIVPKDTPGFSAPEMHGKLSLRASVTSELVFDNVIISENQRLPNAKGLKAPLSCLSQARYSIAWGAIGAAIDCYETALNYSKDRKQFSKHLAAYQLTQIKLVDMLEEITKAQLLAIQLGRLKDQDKASFAQISLAKRNNVAMARNIARSAREILGANGITDDYPIMRHIMNLESVYTYEGTHEMHTLIVGKEITGFDAFD
ncbi:MAG: acyl-CoA dehydrogenase family protein, partial [Candidatus Marinimicrobia bacterium]|nr:acyl-CoA dehydrogenase family protein [Candidatus Neomarinimicrobiota bacterium]